MGTDDEVRIREGEKPEKYVLFGRDLEKIPCFKKTFMTSICSGLSVGLGRFLFTSRVKSAADFGMGTFVIVTLGYWIYCRYNWSIEYENHRQMMRRKSL